MQRALLITLLALASAGVYSGCSSPPEAAAKAEAADSALAQAAEESAPSAADNMSDSGNAAEPTQIAAGETVPLPSADPTTEGEWAHADTPANPPDSVTPEEGRAPDFKITTLEGEVLDSSVLYGTKPVSITIWATWCPPCLAEIPTLQKLYDEHGDEVQFIAISVDDPKQLKEVEKMVAQRKMTYPVGLDVKREIGLAFKASGIPLTVFVDPTGAEVGRVDGWGGEEHLTSAFEKAFFDGVAPAKEKGTSV